MSRFVIVSFLFLGWAFFELSGGTDFRPEPWPKELIASAEAAPAPAAASSSEAIAAVVPSEPQPSDEAIDLAGLDADPSTSVIEPGAGDLAPTFVSLSESLDGSPLTGGAADMAPTEVAAAAVDVRIVDANRLNVRSGPSTGDGVVGQLTRGEEVTLVSSNGSGWALVRLEGDGLEGWVADRFLTQ
ncbi:SH3 domain-containing protein [Wenxinia marina]|uniref:Bacterial SH3 domain protein n=1 Tax=Wenxinia marina DSM 24838 TaxID=1123501 RepID=A0A0D0Q3S8_9RHOB|nr:SH3 domain-containing protein [Wenxinia marina]KIQ69164.1 Bacterial SH3 domain protein [Wenxinia marina DSM 24838]GGL70892.1 hypothetical protein GCM10011392_26740 [Wenxinia marina]